jgi:hypothetical protein
VTAVDVLGRVDELASSVDAVTGAAIGPYRESWVNVSFGRAEYVLRNYRDVAFMNVAQLAAAAGSSRAANVSFGVSFGFEGYPPFQRALHAIIRSELRQVDAAGRVAVVGFRASATLAHYALVAEVARRSRTRALGRLTQLDDLAAARGYLLAGRRAAEL